MSWDPDHPPALARLESMWRALDYAHKCRLSRFLGFMMEAWEERFESWSEEERRQFLYTLDVLLGERLDECSMGYQPWRTDTVGIPMPLDEILVRSFTDAYWQEFGTAEAPAIA